MAICPIHFYGLCLQAHQHGFGRDYFGVTCNVVTAVYPFHLDALQMVLGIPVVDNLAAPIRLEVVDLNDSKNRGFVDLTLVRTPEQNVVETQTNSATTMNVPLGRDLTHILLPTAAPPMVVTKPTRVRVEAHIGAEVFDIGLVEFHFQESPPINDDERRAIESRLGSPKAVMFRFGCKFCEDEFVVGRALNPQDDQKAGEEYVPVPQAPEEWTCRCGKTAMSLTYVKRSLHELLRRQLPQHTQITTFFARLYEPRSIASVCSRFEQLLNSRPREERVQAFLAQHSIVWNFLSPIRVLLKPRVLTSKTADFGILTPGKTLFFVEIEKPQTRLCTRKGGVHADLNCPKNQIRDWRSIVTDDRDALLRSLDIKSDSVDDIRFIIIAGMARNTNPKHLRVIRRERLGDTQFYTFDELAAFLRQLESQLTYLVPIATPETKAGKPKRRPTRTKKTKVEIVE